MMKRRGTGCGTRSPHARKTPAFAEENAACWVPMRQRTSDARAACRPLHRGNEAGGIRTHDTGWRHVHAPCTSRIALAATCHRFMWPFPRRHACLFQPIFCSFTPNVRVRRLPSAPAQGGMTGRERAARTRTSTALRRADCDPVRERRAIIMPHRAKGSRNIGRVLPPAPFQGCGRRTRTGGKDAH